MNKNISKKLPSYRLSVYENFNTLKTSKLGLTNKEASKRLEEDGANTFAVSKKISPIKQYFKQYKDAMIILLVASAAISLFLGDSRTAIVLLCLIIFNTFIGFFQEYRSERTMQALAHLVSPVAHVFRNGNLTEIDSTFLVVGDVVSLSEGDSVPADVRLVETTNFSTNDFSLTGESDPTRKFTHSIKGSVPMANRHNIAYMGTTVATGNAFGIVIAIGSNTELGRIALLSQNAPESQSPLQHEISSIASTVTYGVLGLTFILLILSIAYDLPFKEALLFAIGFASALIPQGLPAEVNTSLATAAGKLAKANVLVKKLSSVESLGAAQVICTDKTGTLTKNEMTVVSFVSAGTSYEVTGTGYLPQGTFLHDGKKILKDAMPKIRDFLLIGVYASNARIEAPDDHSKEWYCIGDPTEGSLIVVAKKADINTGDENQPVEIKELPFDSFRKIMTSIRKFPDNSIVAYVKGAPENVLAKCTHIKVGDVVRRITEKDKEEFLQENTVRANKALRNLAFATRKLSAEEIKQGTMDDIESDLVLQGLVSMVDPLRESVPEAMISARRAHIAINIVTGDFAPTALAIAKQAKVVANDKDLIVISGEELATMPDDEVLKQTLKGGTIFSRVSPEDKMRIVGLVRDAGKVVAVTGDGVNDAPALKHATIGVAMGITGTDVAKEASEIVLLDDSFSSLIASVREGRTIFANIKKGVLSCFTSNMAEMFINLISLTLFALLGMPLALNVLQILAVDLLAEVFPIAALGADKEEGETINERPRQLNEHILNKRNTLGVMFTGFLIGILAISNYVLYFVRHDIDPMTASVGAVASATTMTYITLVICQLLNIIQRRSVNGIFTRYQLQNYRFWLAVTLSIGIVFAITYVPAVSYFFNSGPIQAIDWLFILISAIIFVTMKESIRHLQKKS